MQFALPFAEASASVTLASAAVAATDSAAVRLPDPASLHAWLERWLAKLPPALERRGTLLLPSAALAHELRRAIAVTRGTPGLVFGVTMTRPQALAAEVLARAGRPAAPGLEPVRRLLLRDVFARRAIPSLHYFAAEELASGPGYADAFARTIADLEEAALDPEDLERAAEAEGMAGDRLLAARMDDVAAAWRVLLGEEHGARRTRAGLFRAASAALGARPELGAGLGAVAAILDREPTTALSRFLAQIPGIAIVHLDPGGGGEADVTAGPGEALRAAIPDLALGLHASVVEEVDRAAAWVVEEIAAGTPLDAIAVVVPDVDAYAPLLIDRLTRVEIGGAIPVHVPDRLPAAISPAGRRMLVLIGALQRWLDAPSTLPLLPWFAGPESEEGEGEVAVRALTASAARDIVYGAGILGGREAPGDEWTRRLRERAAVLRGQLEDLAREDATASGGEERRRVKRDRRRATELLERIERVAPAMADLESVGARVRSEASLAELWPAVSVFAARWFRLPPDPPGLAALADRFLDPVLEHPGAGRLRGQAALRFLRAQLERMRLPHGSVGAPAVTITTAAGAAGRSFAVMRILGLAEGVVPRSAHEDPILPESIRARLATDLGCRVPAALDRVREDRGALDRILASGARRFVLSAPREWLDRSERELSGVLLELTAARGRNSGTAILAAFRARLITAAAAEARASRVAALVLPRFSHSSHGPVPVRMTHAAAPGHAAMPSHAAATGAIEPIGAIGPVLAPEALPGLTPAYPISASGLDQLLRCPYWFLLARVLGYREPPRRLPVDEIEASQFGSLVHGIAAVFFTAHGAEFCGHEGKLEEWMQAAGRLADQGFEHFLGRYPLRGQHAIARERERVMRAVTELLRYEWALGPRKFLGAELSFGDPVSVPLAVPGGVLYVEGDMDRVDRFEDRGLEVRDLKTGRPHDLAEKELCLDHDLQIGVYATALGAGGQYPNVRVGAASYVYPRATGDEERRFSGPDLAKLLGQTGRWLAAGRSLLMRGAFVRTPITDDCRFCPFTVHCGERAQVRSDKELRDATAVELRELAAIKGIGGIGATDGDRAEDA